MLLIDWLIDTCFTVNDYAYSVPEYTSVSIWTCGISAISAFAVFGTRIGPIELKEPMINLLVY